MGRKSRADEYFNPDGSIKRLPAIVEVLPDGTRVLDNGMKLRPSMVDFGGERGLVRLDSMTEEERDEWETNLMKKVGKGMTDFYMARETGAFNYK